MAWKKKSFLTHITLLRYMQDDLLIEYKVYKTTREMWEALKEKYGALLVTNLRELVMIFEITRCD